MKYKKTVIVDIGICNIFNVRRAVESLGIEATISRSPKEILDAPCLILPGVGAFGSAMRSLREGDLVQPIQAFSKGGKKILGICLGMQLVMDQSEELGHWKGLGLISGTVEALQRPGPDDRSFKIPHMGWNTLERPEPFSETNDSWRDTLLDDLGELPYAYFVHSFVTKPKDEKNIIACTQYGKDRFCSVICKDNISACQFHPERSAKTGLKILANFFKQAN